MSVYKKFNHFAGKYDMMQNRKHTQEWTITEESFDITKNQVNETLFSLGNGYLGMRGTFEEGLLYHSIEGTYLNGFYETRPIGYGEKMHGFAETSQTMLNVANSKVITLHLDDEEFSLLRGKLLEYRRVLNMRTGILSRRIHWKSPQGKEVEISIERAVLHTRPNLAFISYTVTPLNFDGIISLHSGIDGEPHNGDNGVEGHDPRLGSGFQENVFTLIEKSMTPDSALLIQQTGTTQLRVACGIQHRLLTNRPYTPGQYSEGNAVGHMFYRIQAKQDQSVTLQKYIAYMTSRDVEPEQLAVATCEELQRAVDTGIEGLKQEQASYLDAFWERADIRIEGDDDVQRGLRFNLFHLLQSTGKDGRTNIAAKGLAGQGYEGHYFWDTEIFVLPFFLYTKPEIARKLLEFRYHTLDSAREQARQMSHSRGALYPWRTINGEECSASYDRGTAQYHINADIAFAIRRYVDATDDQDFLKQYGAEILFETARFWIDLGHFDPEQGGQFCIHSVTGPDEYTILVNNNAYTNLMAREHLRFAYETAIWLYGEEPEQYAALTTTIGLQDDEPNSWKEAADKMYVPYNEEKGIIPQDDAFLSKAIWDFEHIPQEHYPLLLHYHPLVLNRYQVCKQADLMLAEFLLNEQFDVAQKKRDYDYYEKITTHDSSLSPCIFGIMASEIGYRNKAYQYFMHTATTDLDDKKGNTKDGIHTANMAGAWMSIVFGFAGMRAHNGVLSFAPTIPEQWTFYTFCMEYKHRQLNVSVDHQHVDIQLLKGKPLDIKLNGETFQLRRNSMNTPINAFIFDLDGVITDTAEYHFQAWSRLAADEGIPFTRKENEHLRGVSRRKSLELLLGDHREGYTEEQMEEMMERKNGYYTTLLTRITEQDILPGTREILHDLKRRGINTAIGSASKNARTILERLGLLDQFDAVSDGLCVEKAKPAPDVFLYAAKELGIEPEHCVVVEDARAGVEAALAGEMIAVGIGPEERVGNAHFRYSTVADMQLDEILG
jgi:alpha,alpha-trehalose phosphorylase